MSGIDLDGSPSNGLPLKELNKYYCPIITRKSEYVRATSSVQKDYSVMVTTSTSYGSHQTETNRFGALHVNLGFDFRLLPL